MYLPLISIYGSVLAPSSTFHLKLRLAFIAFSPDCPDLPRPLDLRYAGLMICIGELFIPAAIDLEYASFDVESYEMYIFT